MSDHAKFKGGVKGIFHTDELPGYNISIDEVNRLKLAVDANEGDAVVIVADQEEKCNLALTAVVDRAKQALHGVPAETRSANPDGTTRYTRPRPGAARMYPETDIKPVQVESEMIDNIMDRLPEMPEVKLARYQKYYSLNKKLANQVIDSDYLSLFEILSLKGIPSTLLAVTLTEDITKLRRDGVPVDDLTDDKIIETFMLVKNEITEKESIPEIFKYLAKNPNSSARESLTILGLEMLSEEELNTLIDQEIQRGLPLIKERGMKAIGPLMGAIMSKVRGKAKPKKVQALLSSAIRTELE
jgi:glutamyl-tRNA(Gln) amidotransferase subunit E